jgi:hypothetical protein
LERVITGIWGTWEWLQPIRQRCLKSWRKMTFKGASTNGDGGGTSALRLEGIEMMYPIICKIQILWT